MPEPPRRSTGFSIHAMRGNCLRSALTAELFDVQKESVRLRNLGARQGFPLIESSKSCCSGIRVGKHFLLICPAAECVDFILLREQFGSKPTLVKRDEVSAATEYQPNSVPRFGITRQLPLYAAARLYHDDRVYLGSGTPRVDIEIKTQSVLEALQPIRLT
jgi:prolyl-tRNA editing enzyme YbaK/EbsC (Cys-tRNA(Pro) deacylase)